MSLKSITSESTKYMSERMIAAKPMVMNVLLMKNGFNDMVRGYIRINGQRVTSGKPVTIPADKHLIITFLFSFLVNFKKIRLVVNENNDASQPVKSIQIIEKIDFNKFVVSSTLTWGLISILAILFHQYSQSLIPMYAGIPLFVISVYANFVNNITLYIDER